MEQAVVDPGYITRCSVYHSRQMAVEYWGRRGLTGFNGLSETVGVSVSPHRRITKRERERERERAFKL